jgi:hypothetical protein
MKKGRLDAIHVQQLQKGGADLKEEHEGANDVVVGT